MYELGNYFCDLLYKKAKEKPVKFGIDVLK